MSEIELNELNDLNPADIVKFYYPSFEGEVYIELADGRSAVWTKHGTPDGRMATEWMMDNFHSLPVEAEVDIEETPLWPGIETSATPGVTFKDEYAPDCPLCGAEAQEGDEGPEYECGHFVGMYNAWFHEPEYKADYAREATHRVITSHELAGTNQWFFSGPAAPSLPPTGDTGPEMIEFTVVVVNKFDNLNTGGYEYTSKVPYRVSIEDCPTARQHPNVFAQWEVIFRGTSEYDQAMESCTIQVDASEFSLALPYPNRKRHVRSFLASQAANVGDDCPRWLISDVEQQEREN